MKVLVAIDGSHNSRNAVSAMARRTWPADSIIKFVHASERPQVENREFQEIVAECVSIFQSCPSSGLVLDCEYIERADVRHAIHEAAATWPADLVVLGSRGHSLLEDLLIGSVSQWMLEHAHGPVLIAREVEVQAFGNVIVSVDDSESSAAAVEWLAMQPWAANATIALVSVAKDRAPDIAGKSVKKASEAILEWETERGLLGVALEYWWNFLRARLPYATVNYGVADGDPREMIARAARNWPAECIVMGASGRRGLAKLLLGSVSQNIAAHAECSVEVVRGIPSEYYSEVSALIEKHRAENPLLLEPSHQQFGTQVSNSPLVFFW